MDTSYSQISLSSSESINKTNGFNWTVFSILIFITLIGIFIWYFEIINYDKCMARRINGGYGGQCTRYKLKGSKYCKNHQTEEQRWCGLITEKRQEICYLKGIHPHKWKN